MRGDAKVQDVKNRIDDIQRELWVGNACLQASLIGLLHHAHCLPESAERFQLLLNRAHVAPVYHKLFYDFYYRHTQGEKIVMIDGGVHQGVFTDVALACGAKVYGFEPNRYLAAFLKKLYQNTPEFLFYENAIGTKNETLHFLNDGESVVSAGAGVVQNVASTYRPTHYDVLSIDFVDFLRKLLQEEQRVHLMKLDIEGAEFDVLDALLDTDLLQFVDYLMVETHERFFAHPQEKIVHLKEKIRQKGLNNIYLDWV